MRVPTIEDVAKAAGVSKATVSRILNGEHPYIRESTRQRVEQAIQELGYRPSSVARSLTSKRTQTIGILISDVGNPFYADVIHGVEDATLRQGYNIFLCNTNYDPQRGLALVRSLVDRRADGVLIMSSMMPDEWLAELARSQVPVVVVDWEAKTQPGSTFDAILGIITIDYRKGIQQAAEHLVKAGHRHFAHLSGPLHLRTARDRRDLFLAALKNLGIDPNSVAVFEGDLTMNGGRASGEKLLAAFPQVTAAFAANDLMALGLLSAARSAGRHIPADLSIVGLDDIWLSAQADPPLTSVALPRYEIGKRAAELLFELLARLKNQPLQPLTVELETGLVIRQSTAPAAVENTGIEKNQEG